MRLSAGRRAQWLREREAGWIDVGVSATQAGASEVLRLGRGDPIVLVPGLAGGWRLVAPLAHRLARRHEVFLVSHRGDSGLSNGARPDSIGDYAEALAKVIDDLRLERPTVFGVSFGGAVALELAADHPGCLGALVVQGVEAKFRGGVGAKVARRVLERFPLPSDNRFVNQFFNILHGRKPDPGPLPDFVVRRCWETDQGVMARRLQALESFDVSDRLWRIESPTLVLSGTRDVVTTPEGHRSLARAIGDARLVALEAAGHIGFLSHRGEVANHVARFVRARVGTHSS